MICALFIKVLIWPIWIFLVVFHYWFLPYFHCGQKTYSLRDFNPLKVIESHFMAQDMVNLGKRPGALGKPNKQTCFMLWLSGVFYIDQLHHYVFQIFHILIVFLSVHLSATRKHMLKYYTCRFFCFSFWVWWFLLYIFWDFTISYIQNTGLYIFYYFIVIKCSSLSLVVIHALYFLL